MFKFYDLAGQVDKRSIWTQYFENGLNCIIYVLSIASFDQYLEEDKSINRFEDSLNCYKQIIKNKLLAGVSIIVFFNKMDLFTEKLKTIDFKRYIQDYEGSHYF